MRNEGLCCLITCLWLIDKLFRMIAEHLETYLFSINSEETTWCKVLHLWNYKIYLIITILLDTFGGSKIKWSVWRSTLSLKISRKNFDCLVFFYQENVEPFEVTTPKVPDLEQSSPRKKVKAVVAAADEISSGATAKQDIAYTPRKVGWLNEDVCSFKDDFFETCEQFLLCIDLRNTESL